ncbi:dpcd [Acrasis kona]|uniref:Protein DPCD n=1 Tax=Acrasis kona TaxID=1008807 RepID=A0AAW2ZLP6_9EUKA
MTKEDSADKKYPYTSSIVKDGRKKVHTTFEDQSEMVEEFDVNNNKLLVRKWRRPTKLGGEGEWEFEIGAEVKPFNPMNDLFAPSTDNPVVVRSDTSDSFQWRIRNCFFDKNVYQVTVDVENQSIVIRTSNKKYYKVIQIPDMIRLKQQLIPQSLQWSHSNNTLIISYPKPPALVQQERVKEHQLRQLNSKEGDVQCPQQ